MSSISKRVILFSSSLIGAYHKDILVGASRYAKENNITLLAYTGGPIKAGIKSLNMRTAIYSAFDPETVDGVILPVSSMSRFVSEEEFSAFCEVFHGVPIVSLGTPFKDYPTVKPDYLEGMARIVDHLVQVHGRKKILLFRGKESHRSSIEREAGYKMGLARNGIKFDEKYVFKGTLVWDEDSEQLAQFLTEKGIFFDALVAVNDNSAIRIIGLLGNMGYSVPNDISVVGFQGIADGEFSAPSLSTMDEVTQELGYRALNVLDSLMAGQKVSSKTVVETRFIRRRSCGCRGVKDAQVERDQSSGDSQIQEQRNDHLKEQVNRLKNTINLFRPKFEF
ncbi:MAG: LacI family DNA-binding transcriptional regulator [Spirochaetales bacterium]|nr:LacI family DNA-binding transcriptional regulator [Spirochaetales bacterium]